MPRRLGTAGPVTARKSLPCLWRCSYIVFGGKAGQPILSPRGCCKKARFTVVWDERELLRRVDK